jgi:hypothetical protein
MALEVHCSPLDTNGAREWIDIGRQEEDTIKGRRGVEGGREED